MALYLALDVGGTKTACVLGDEERVLARAEGGSIKTLRIPGAEARANLEAVLLQLVSATGADLRQVRRTCIGTSGFSAPGVRAWMHQAIAETIGSELVLLGDEVIALDAAFPGTRGVLVIAGTGSNIVGRAATGQMTHTGGWGPMLADEGSGHWIGHQALRACFRAIDEAPASSADYVAGGEAAGAPGALRSVASPAGFFSERRLSDLPPLMLRFLEHLRLPDLDAIIGAANALEFRFAQLVPVVVEAALAGDPLAARILQEAGEALALLVSQTIAKMESLEAGLAERPAAPGVAYIGGVLTNIQAVRSAMHRALDRRYPGIVLHPEPADALAGALWHARGCRP
jgi:N-acetylglucosamine kinase-like BadF-type ATPase